jgi:transposase
MIPRQDDSRPNDCLPLSRDSCIIRVMTDQARPLPTDIDALHALIVAERSAHAAVLGQRDRLDRQNDTLRQIIKGLQRARFGRSSEKLSEDQAQLALEDIETAVAKGEGEQEKSDAAIKRTRTQTRRTNRGALPAHLPRVDVVIEPEDTCCPNCRCPLHVIGEDTSERLDKIPAVYRVIVTRRPKLACRSCTDGVVQAPAPARLIEGGLPTEAMVTDVVISKYADHCPLYRQSQIIARSGINIDRSTLASWVGAAAAELEPLYDHLVQQLLAAPKLFADETRCPVLDPGRGKTKTGFFWAIARDDRPWGGNDPPAVAYSYAPGRGADHVIKLLTGFSGVLQVDGYTVYKQLAQATRPGGPVTLAYCWSHLRRKFYEVYVGGNAPIATEALARLGKLYEIEAEINGLDPALRRALRQAKAKPLVDELKLWFEAALQRISKGSKLGEAIRYGLRHWDGLGRYLADGRIEIDSNTVERSMRPIALSRKNALFAGHDQGAANWGIVASLIETCKLNGVDPHAWMADTLTKLVNLWPATAIDASCPGPTRKSPLAAPSRWDDYPAYCRSSCAAA